MHDIRIVIVLLLTSLLYACGTGAVISNGESASFDALAVLGQELFFDTLLFMFGFSYDMNSNVRVKAEFVRNFEGAREENILVGQVAFGF